MSTTTKSSVAPLDDPRPPQAPSFPFADLLDALRLKEIPIGVSDYQSVARLIERWDGARVSELRSALAALLATRVEQIAVIQQTFDDLYQPDEEEDDRREPAEEGWTARLRRQLRAWHIGAAAALVLLGVIVVRLLFPTAPIPQPDLGRTTTTPPIQETVPVPSEGAPPPPPALPPPPVSRDTTLLPLLTALAGVVIGSGVWALRTRSVQSASIRSAWRGVLASLPGPFYYRAAVASVLSPSLRRAVSDAATILGRRFTENITSDELDVEDSLARTLKAGLRPVLVFKTPPVPSPILILRDLSSEMRVWDRKVDAFIHHLEVSGVLVETWYFDEDASFVSRTLSGRVVPLASLASRHDGSAMLVISTGAGVPRALERPARAWTRMLAEWEDRAWLTPINHALYWRPELRKPGVLPLQVYPMTRLGVVAAARALVGGDVQHDVRPPTDVRTVSSDEVERMKRLVALVPYPTLELAERLRQRFYPSMPEEVLLYLAEESGARSPQTIRFSDAEVARLVAAERRDAPEQELEVRRFLRRILDQSEPSPGSVAHLRWELDRAIQQLHLSRLAPGEESLPRDTLSRLTDGPLGAEARAALGLAAAAGLRRDQHDIRKLQTRAWAAPSLSDEQETRRVFRWTWPGVIEPLAGAVAAVLAYLALNAWGPFPTHTIAHRLDAYELEWVAPASPDQPGSLIARRLASDGDTSIPADAELYRDREMVDAMKGLSTTGSRAVFMVPPAQTGAYYQLRAPLASRNLAVSNAVFVPGRPSTPEAPAKIDAPVAITVNLQPWARVRIVAKDSRTAASVPAGPFETPFTVSLVPGDYVLECENGGVTPPLSLALRVDAGQSQTISRAMPGFDPARLVDNLLGQTRK